MLTLLKSCIAHVSSKQGAQGAGYIRTYRKIGNCSDGFWDPIILHLIRVYKVLRGIKQPLLDKCTGFFYMRYTTHGTNGFTSHPKVMCLAYGHKCHGWGFEPTLCWSETPEFESGALNCSATTLQKTLFDKWLTCCQSGPAPCTAVGCLQVACKSWLRVTFFLPELFKLCSIFYYQVQLATDYSNATAKISSLQLELTAVQQREMQLKTQLNTGMNTNQEHLSEMEAMRAKQQGIF